MTEVTLETLRPDPGERRRSKHVPRRIRVAEIVAFIGLVAAFIGALGPASEARTTYSWPPKTLPESAPARLWYTPLLLASRIPEKLAASIPCAIPAALASSANPVIVLSTARSSELVGGLVVTSDGERVAMRVGTTTLARTSEPGDNFNETNCVHRLEIASGRWSLKDGVTNRALGGELEQMPVVNGLFSGVDLRSETHPSIDVTTRPHRAVTLGRQALAWVIAVTCLLAAVILVVFERRPKPTWGRALGAARGAISAAGPVDASVGILLLGWWLIAPAFFDDGWTIARQTAFITAGGFSNYYESFGTSLPLGYWLEWVQHWLTQSTEALLVLRVPALLCLAATWVVCRWILAQLLGSSRSGRSVALWALGASFAAMVMAWGMTLRQEPTVALLVAGVMACCVRFLQSRGAAPLAVAAILIPLAATAHPAGIVSLAPLVAVLPAALRWARGQPASAVALFTASGALFLVLAFVGSDVQQRARDARTISAVSTTVVDWREELVRYAALSHADADGLSGYGTPLRRASVALMFLAALAFVGRRRRGKRTLLELPATTLVVALVLLIATPSKWPWHFGALIALAALAVASETLRLRDELAESKGWQTRPFVAVGAVLLAIAWSWWPRGAWNVLDLRTLDWTPGLEAWLPLSKFALAIPLVVLGVGIALARRRGNRAFEAPWRVASWSAPILAVPLIAFTLGVLAVDAGRTASWTLPRQNVEVLRGERRCGIADELLVLAASSVRPLPIYGSANMGSTPAWVPSAPVRGLPRFALGPVSEMPSFSPWFVVPPHQGLGLFVAGKLAVSDRLMLEWGHIRTGQIESLRSDLIPLRSSSEQGSSVPWRFVSAGELEAPAPGATVVRVALFNDAPSRAAIAVTAPVTYANESLERRLRGTDSSALVQPNLLTFIPCARLPRLGNGIVDVPRTLITTRDSISPLRYRETSPFAGLLDMYDLERLPLADSKNPPKSVVVFGLERRIRAAALAPPDKVTTVS